MYNRQGSRPSPRKRNAKKQNGCLGTCPTLCDPIDGSPPGSPFPGILQARTLEWVAIAFSNALKSKVKGKSLSRVQLFATPWTAAYQAPPCMGFARQEYWICHCLLQYMSVDHLKFQTSLKNCVGLSRGQCYLPLLEG